MNVPFPDDDDDELPMNIDNDVTAGVGESHASMNLSLSRDDSTNERSTTGNAIKIGGLDDSSNEGEEANRKRKRGPSKTTRKRRRIQVDERTELRGSEVKACLEDTSDITNDFFVHPATWVEGVRQPDRERSDIELLRSHLSFLKQFTRPAVAEEGQLAPVLLELWARNAAPVLGKPFPYRRNETPENEIEIARRQDSSDVGSQGNIDDDDMRRNVDDDDQIAPPLDNDEDMPPVNLDDDAHTHNEYGLDAAFEEKSKYDDCPSRIKMRFQMRY